MRSLDLRGAFRGVRFREREIFALDTARELTRETASAFIRRAALAEARRLIETVWDTAQQRRDNDVIDKIQESRDSGAQ